MNIWQHYNEDDKRVGKRLYKTTAKFYLRKINTIRRVNKPDTRTN
jgi:hypothetical protein